MRVAMTFAVLLVAATSVANPIAEELYIDFDPPNRVEDVYPAPYTTVDAYVVVDLLGYYGQDIYAISFDVEMLFGLAVIAGDFVPAHGGYIVQIVDNGITVIAEDCINDSPAVLGYVPVFYIGQPDCVHITPHIDNGHTFVACSDMQEYEWCFAKDGGIGMPPVEIHRYCYNPVEDVAWGAIKAMYR